MKAVWVQVPTLPPTSISSRRPRWKRRINLGVFAIAPGTYINVAHTIAEGMARLHIQRRQARRGWVIETYWGSPASCQTKAQPESTALNSAATAPKAGNSL